MTDPEIIQGKFSVKPRRGGVPVYAPSATDPDGSNSSHPRHHRPCLLQRRLCRGWHIWASDPVRVCRLADRSRSTAMFVGQPHRKPPVHSLNCPTAAD